MDLLVMLGAAGTAGAAIAYVVIAHLLPKQAAKRRALEATRKRVASRRATIARKKLGKIVGESE